MPLLVRPLERGDRTGLAAAFDRLSAQSRYERFLGPKPRLSPRELDELTDLDRVHRDAVAAFDPATGELVGVARYATYRGDPCTADIAVTVADGWQGQGLGTMLACAIVERAAGNGICRLVGTALAGNARSLALLRR